MSTAIFLQELFPSLDKGEFIELRFVTEGTKECKSVFLTDLKDVEAIAQANSGDLHVFVGAAPRNKQRGTKKDIPRVHVLWGEVDSKDVGGKEEALKKISSGFVFPPTMTVDSGHGYHGYWSLDQPCDPERAEELMLRIRARISGGAIQDCSRVMRVPGTLNIKAGESVPCQLLRYLTGLKYTTSDVEKALNLDAQTLSYIRDPQPPPEAVDQSRSGVDWAVIRRLLKAGLSNRAIRTIYAYQPIGEKSREEANLKSDYLGRTLAKVEATAPKFTPVLTDATKGVPSFVEQVDTPYSEEELAEEIVPEDALPPPMDSGGTDEHGVPLSLYFVEDDDTYRVRNSGRVASTFTFEPIRMLYGESEDSFIGSVRSSGILWPDVVLPRDAFTRIITFLKHLHSMQWQWLGSDREVRLLLPYLVNKWQENGSPSAKATSVLGRHGDFWVAEEGTFNKDDLMDMYTAPIVYTPTKRKHPVMNYVEIFEEAELKRLIESVAFLLPKINEPSVVWPTIGWFMGTPLKPLLNQLPSPVRFPHLNLYGTKGCGKTSTVQKVFQRLLGYATPESLTCSTTAYVLLAVVSSTNSIPISLSEFRRSTMLVRNYENLKRVLLLSYDYGRDSRGRPNQTTTEYTMTAPLVLDGEDVISDPAIQDRTIYVNLKPDTIREGSSPWEAFEELTLLELEGFARAYIQYTLSLGIQEIELQWLEAYEETKKVFHEEISDRVRRNLATVLFGIHVYTRFLQKYGITMDPFEPEMLSATLAEVHEENLGRGRIAIDDFVEDVITEVAKSIQVAFICDYETERNILWIHLRSAINWWYVERRKSNQATLESSAIKKQLRELTGDVAGKGRYALAPKTRRMGARTLWMYGVDVGVAYTSGLDVPKTLIGKTVTVRLQV